MNEESLSQLYLKDTAFGELMQRRIFNVLLVASPYDAFMMEEDGRVEEQLYNEYVALNLSSPPRITRVANIDGALEAMRAKHFDLVIAMPGMDISATFSTAKTIKAEFPAVPIGGSDAIFKKRYRAHFANFRISQASTTYSPGWAM